MKKNEVFFDKATIIFTAISIAIIVAVGCVFLVLEHIDKSVIMKSSNSNKIESNIDNIYSAPQNENKNYSSEFFGLININTASKEELTLLPGIGDVKADAIIAYREEKQFTKIEELLNVKGIGEKTFEKIKDDICVN